MTNTLRPRITVALLVVSLLLPLPLLAKSKSEKRANIDAQTTATLEKILEKSDSAKKNFEKSYGYAVFDNIKISLGLSGGGGHGVAINKSTGERTYMKMGTAGLNLGFGGQKYQILFLMETAKAFDRFVNVGWTAEATANAAAGSAGVNVSSGFNNGLAIYQITDKGLMLQADVSGTKYWKNGKLNR